jgi:hypothetical protein
VVGSTTSVVVVVVREGVDAEWMGRRIISEAVDAAAAGGSRGKATGDLMIGIIGSAAAGGTLLVFPGTMGVEVGRAAAAAVAAAAVAGIAVVGDDTVVAGVEGVGVDLVDIVIVAEEVVASAVAAAAVVEEEVGIPAVAEADPSPQPDSVP